LTGNDPTIPKSFFFQRHLFLFGNIPVKCPEKNRAANFLKSTNKSTPWTPPNRPAVHLMRVESKKELFLGHVDRKDTEYPWHCFEVMWTGRIPSIIGTHRLIPELLPVDTLFVTRMFSAAQQRMRVCGCTGD